VERIHRPYSSPSAAAYGIMSNSEINPLSPIGSIHFVLHSYGMLSSVF
jgi:hypothetical protein